jgi:hypothetical protein
MLGDYCLSGSIVLGEVLKCGMVREYWVKVDKKDQVAVLANSLGVVFGVAFDVVLCPGLCVPIHVSSLEFVIQNNVIESMTQLKSILNDKN